LREITYANPESSFEVCFSFKPSFIYLKHEPKL
jgi:hypothetical protein